MTLERGAFLHNRYRILEILGQGGMGSIYRAIDENLGVEVAVKENLFTTDEYARQFRREAIILANLRQLNLPRVSDHFVIDGQGQYLVMDYIEGDDLRERMDRVGEIPESRILEIGMAICDAMSYMHTRKPPVLHRDIKPGNVKITSLGHIYLVDFGLAKIVQAGQQTSTGARAMTPGYSPPEQYGAARTDHRSDIYSLGATMYAALGGAIPEDSLARTMEQTELTPLRKRNSKISRRAASAIEKALEVHPDDRFQTAGEFKQALILAYNASKSRGLIESIPSTENEEDLGESWSDASTEQPSSDGLSVSNDNDALPIPINTPLVETDSFPSSKNKKRRGRGCLVTVIIVIVLIALGTGISYLVDPNLTIQTYQAASTQVVSFVSSGEILIRNIPTTQNEAVEATLSDTDVPELQTTDLPSASSTPRKTSTPTPTPTSTEIPEDTLTPTLAVTPTSTPQGGGYGQIAFVSARSGQAQIWIVNVDGTGLKQISTTPSGACQPDWSPDGSRIVFTSPCKYNRETYLGSGLFIIDVDGNNMVSLPIQGIGSFDPAWSPDGSKILFSALKTADRPQIWITDLETGEFQILSVDLNRDLQPTWAPDGSHILFVSLRQGPYQIWTMAPDGSNQERFSVSGDLKNSNPVLSPSGQLLVFTQSEGLGSFPGLVGVSYPDGAPNEFNLYTSFGAGPMKEADFSPDGFWVAFESWPDSVHNIWIMTPNGAERTQISFDPIRAFDPVWRPISP